MSIERIVGQAVKNLRAGEEKLFMHAPGLQARHQTLSVTSPTFIDGEPLPNLYTIDGERGSPAISWSDAGPQARSYAVVVEDIDVPLPQPLVHAIVYNISSDMLTLPEDAIPRDGDPKMTAFVIGRNSLGQQGYLPPAPIRGHGVHRYVFEVFALDTTLEADTVMHLRDLHEAMRGHVLAQGHIIGTYERR